MSVGDLAGPTRRFASSELIRIRGEAAGGLAAMNDFAADRVFAIPPPRRSWSRRLISKIFGLGSWMGKEAPVSLISLIDTHHDVFTYGTRGGTESVAVPFAHLVLLSGAFHRNRGRAAEEQIRDAVQRYFGRYVDDLTGVRVMCRDPGGIGENEILLFFGKGVFVPRNGEQPTGSIGIANEDARDSSEGETLLLAGGIPAAFYRGQAAVAFSFNSRSAPAVADILPSRGDSFFYLGPSDQLPGGVDLVWHPGVRTLAPSASYAVRPAMPQAGADASFTITDDGGQVLTLNCMCDSRPSRLHRLRPPTGRIMEIIGVVAPTDDDFLGSVHRWWVDVDREDRLLGGAMGSRAFTILCEGAEVSRYDWQDFGFMPAVPAHHLIEVNVGKNKLRVLRAPEGAPLGYLAAPETSQPAVFGDRWWSEDGFALDWLDFTGGVESWSGVTRGLASDAAQRWPNARMPGVRSRTGAPAVPGHFVRPAGAGSFTSSWNGEWTPGMEFIVGPLLLRIFRE